jgi:glycosyltransferase involved in cell wall biosynthesis
VFKQNGGQGSAFNAGFKSSQGGVVLFLDADDTLLPTAVENAVRACQAADVVKVHWPLWIVNEQGSRTGRITPQATLPEGDLRPILAREGPLSTASPPTSGNAWTRPLLEQLLPIPSDYTLCADEYLYALAPAFGIVQRVVEPQGTYRLHARNGYLGKPIEEKVAFGRRIQDLQCDIVAARLRSLGFDVAPERWKRQQWFRRLGDAIDVIRETIPPECAFILVDDDQWGVQDTLAQRRCLPFLERNGRYWGPPADDQMAIEELRRQRRAGADFLVFAWPAFWWLEHYRAFHRELEARYRCLIRSDDLRVFDLRCDLAEHPPV